MTSTAEPLVFNPFDPEFRVDPYKSYRRFLAEDPVHQSMFGGWVVTRHLPGSHNDPVVLST